MKANLLFKYSCTNCDFSTGYQKPKGHIRKGVTCPKCFDGILKVENKKPVNKLTD